MSYVLVEDYRKKEAVFREAKQHLLITIREAREFELRSELASAWRRYYPRGKPSVGDPGYYLEATEEFDPRSWPPDGQKVADALFACHQAYRCALKTFWAVSHEDREHFGLTAAPEP